MRFHYGAVPEDDKFGPEDQGFRPIREPGPLALQVMAIPVAIGVLLAWVILVFFYVLPRGSIYEASTGQTPLSISFIPALLMVLLVIPIHELLHALFHPGWGLSERTVLGLWLSKGIFYAHYEGEMTRNRFLLVFITPFLILGVLPIVILANLPDPWFSTWLMQVLTFLSLLGSIVACGDLVGTALAFFQIPASALVRNKGWRTYWKPAQ